MTSPGAPAHRVSVVIPAFRDWDRLRRCVAAVAAQSLPAETVDIIVVDNDDQPLPAAQRPAGARYVHQPEGFSYAARNAGIAAARAPAVAFTDSDCLPEPDWLAAGLAALEQADLVGGAIEIFRERDTLAARYDCAYGLRQADYFRNWGAFATANLLVRRTALERIGPFSERLESGGDFELCWRARDAGLRLAYAPAAGVRHPAREAVGELAQQSRRQARGIVEFHYRRHFPRRARAWRAAATLLRPRLYDWTAALTGGRGSEVLPARQRPAVLALRVLMHYVFALSVIAALRRSMRERGWP